MIFGSPPLCYSTLTPQKWARRKYFFCALILLFGVSQLPVYAQSRGAGKADRLLGIYVFVGERLTADSTEKLPAGFMPFVKFCGYNTLEFCDYSFEYPESERTTYLEAFRARIADVHRQGLRVFMILATNMSHKWSSLSAEPGGDELTKIMFNAVAHPDEFKQRVADVRQSITSGFSEADGFEVFAGDWGGCMGEGCDYKQYLSFARAYAQILRDLDLRSQLTLNTWGIADWGASFDPFKAAFWDAETELSAEVIDSDISFATAVTLPGHNLYRGLTQAMYTQANRAVPEWPDSAAIEKIHAKGKLAYLWPHFIVDDDRSRKMTWRKVHFEVRYLKELAEKCQALGIDGVFVNAYNPPYQMGNVFAYGQLNRDSKKPVRTILRDFAALIAQPGDVDELTEVFTFLENHSWWGSQMPAPYRLKPLPCKLGTYAEARAALDRVAPLRNSPAPLLMTPKDYLAQVDSTLSFMQENYDK
jgi:hypothetical protein